MVDHHALPGLVAGLAGMACGVGAAVLGTPILAVAAAGLALVAGATCVLQARRVHHAAQAASGTAALANLLDLPQRARDEARSLVDPESGLPDARFFDLAVEGRVAAARRHLWPVTIVLVEVTLAHDAGAGTQQSQAVAAFAQLLRRTLREADIACRLGDMGFGLVLEDTGEEGGVWATERLKAALGQQSSRVRHLAAGVATYPTHGLRADEVMTRAQAALTRACAAGHDQGLVRVEVAQHDFA